MRSNDTFRGKDTRMICRHFMEGRIEMPKLCLFSHECRHCAYDQWLDETGRTERPSSVAAVSACEALAA